MFLFYDKTHFCKMKKIACFIISLALIACAGNERQDISNGYTPEEVLFGSVPLPDGVADCALSNDVYKLADIHFTDSTLLVQRVNIVYFSNDTARLDMDRTLWVERIKLANTFLDANSIGVKLSLQPSVEYITGEPWGDERTHKAIAEQEQFTGIQRQDLREYFLMDHDAFWHKVYGRENALNIYVYNDMASAIPGRAGAISSNWFSLRVDYLEPSFHTFEHEIGHCWALFHTHQPDDSGQKYGYVSGDRVCDTPASPSIAGRVNDSCFFVKRDPSVESMPSYMNEFDLEVLSRNLMSYTNKSCRKEITSGQRSRVRKNFEMNPEATKTLVGYGPDYTSDLAPIIDVRTLQQRKKTSK